jgi:glycosyltransferase involved in cell wall biosynthesis
MELNELNQNAKGGTELMADRLYSYVDNRLFDEFQIIQSRVRDLDSKKKKILWLHDLHGDGEVSHLKDGGWKKFDKLVFVSHWQQQMYNAYLGVPFDAGVVLKNAIKPIEEHQKPDDKIRLIYYSTPHRGLELLYPAFDELCKHYDDVELTVYSSFGLYGWPQRDEPYKQLFKALDDHPRIRYSGSVSNKHIRNELKNHHIFAYPSIWQETSCLCLIEAMSAGLECVHSSLAALPETSMGLTRMYQYTEDMQVHVNTFFQALVNAVEIQKQVKPDYQVQKLVANHEYNWDTRAKEWTNLLTSLL